MSIKSQAVYIRDDRRVLDDCEVTISWATSADVSNLTTSTTHKEGANSISFDKDGVTESFGQISKTLTRTLDLTNYFDGWLKYRVNLSDLTNISNIQLIIGEDASNNYVYQTADTALSTGWNELLIELDSPSSTNGAGANWKSIDYIALKINFDANGDTLTSILLDAISVINKTNLNVEEINLVTTGLATSANQATSNASLSSIDGKLVDGIASSATLASIASSATSTTLQAANSNRIGWLIHNDSTSALKVKFGATASATSFTVEIPSGDYFEMPTPIYTGVIDGIWDSANGSARVTELI